MAGIIKDMINKIYTQRANNNPSIVATLKVKLVLKGIYPDIYTQVSPDNPAIIEKVKTIANEMGVEV